MSQWEHVRQDGYLAAWRELNRRSAARKDIPPARVIFAYRHASLHSVSRWITEWWAKDRKVA